ncbi:MAG TPA: STY4526/YPO1902 family pathogenicity island replication protein [Pseudomonadales bacterium]|nr:STY4526/YPO1902 family pathogenicity island replication protein [Pseudomonadales bacterium]
MEVVTNMYYLQKRHRLGDDAFSSPIQAAMDKAYWNDWFEDMQGTTMTETSKDDTSGWESRDRLSTPVGVRTALQVLIKETLSAGCRSFRDSKTFWKQVGLEENLLREVEALNVQEFDEFTAMVTHYMLMNNLSFDVAVLNRSAGLLIRQKAENHLLNEFVIAGASSPMLRDLFGLRSHDIVAIRERLGVSQPGGRPRRASREEAADIMRCWFTQLASVDVRLRLLWVHQETQQPLTCVFDVVRIHDRASL